MMWYDSVEDITPMRAETEENAIEYAIEYMTDIDDKEQIAYWSDPSHYMAELDED